MIHKLLSGGGWKGWGAGIEKTDVGESMRK